MRQENITDL